jgi:pimeloyl-ACP methyl ester carboxylesterase
MRDCFRKTPPFAVAFLFAAGFPVRGWLAVAAIVLGFVAGCARVPDLGVTTLREPTFAALEKYVVGHDTSLDQFRLRGPFAVTTDLSRSINISDREYVTGDLFLAAPAGKAPLVIFLHGYASTKEEHTYQAMHAASWGLHSLAIQLPNTGSWTTNGRTLARLVSAIRRAPEAIDRRIDPDNIILVGHSFGGTSVSIALAEGAPAAGGILLDPAAVGSELPAYLRKVRKPMMVLGADEHVSVARNRSYFFHYVNAGVGEVSIRGASHEDAQYPSPAASTSEEMQVSFASALTVASISLAATGGFDYAWTSFATALRDGSLFDARKK